MSVELFDLNMAKYDAEFLDFEGYRVVKMHRVDRLSPKTSKVVPKVPLVRQVVKSQVQRERKQVARVDTRAQQTVLARVSNFMEEVAVAHDDVWVWVHCFDDNFYFGSGQACSYDSYTDSEDGDYGDYGNSLLGGGLYFGGGLAACGYDSDTDSEVGSYRDLGGYGGLGGYGPDDSDTDSEDDKYVCPSDPRCPCVYLQSRDVCDTCCRENRYCSCDDSDSDSDDGY